MSKYYWLKGSHMTKVVWLPNETDYSYCEFVAPNAPYWTESPPEWRGTLGGESINICALLVLPSNKFQSVTH